MALQWGGTTASAEVNHATTNSETQKMSQNTLWVKNFPCGKLRKTNSHVFLYLSKGRVEVAEKGAWQLVETWPWTQSSVIGQHRKNHKIFWKGVLPD